MCEEYAPQRWICRTLRSKSWRSCQINVEYVALLDGRPWVGYNELKLHSGRFGGQLEDAFSLLGNRLTLTLPGAQTRPSHFPQAHDTAGRAQ